MTGSVISISTSHKRQTAPGRESIMEVYSGPPKGRSEESCDYVANAESKACGAATVGRLRLTQSHQGDPGQDSGALPPVPLRKNGAESLVSAHAHARTSARPRPHNDADTETNRVGQADNRQIHLSGPPPPSSSGCRARHGPAEGAPPPGSRAAAARSRAGEGSPRSRTRPSSSATQGAGPGRGDGEGEERTPLESPGNTRAGGFLGIASRCATLRLLESSGAKCVCVCV